MPEQYQTEQRRNGRGLIAIGTLGIMVLSLLVTVAWQQMSELRHNLESHKALPHHAEMGEKMASVRQQIAQQDLKTADRFTRTDWMAAQKWILTLFDHVDHRLEMLEATHDQEHKQTRPR